MKSSVDVNREKQDGVRKGFSVWKGTCRLEKLAIAVFNLALGVRALRVRGHIGMALRALIRNLDSGARLLLTLVLCGW